MTSALCTSFKKEILEGVHESGDTYKMLLIKVAPSGTYDAAITNVGTPGSGAPSTSNVGTDEVTGTGYTSGGVTLAGYTTGSSGTTAWIDWTTDPSWSTATLSAIGAIIYNATQGNKAVAVLDFGGTKTVAGVDFTIQLPAADASNAIIRIG
jgi:hypothetical protein